MKKRQQSLKKPDTWNGYVFKNIIQENLSELKKQFLIIYSWKEHVF